MMLDVPNKYYAGIVKGVKLESAPLIPKELEKFQEENPGPWSKKPKIFWAQTVESPLSCFEKYVGTNEKTGGLMIYKIDTFAGILETKKSWFRILDCPGVKVHLDMIVIQDIVVPVNPILPESKR